MYFFGDSFDLYAVNTDAYATGTYWDSGGNTNWSIAAGRFSSSRCLRNLNTGIYLRKVSGQNDSVHHFNVGHQQTQAISGSTLAFYIQLLDGATPQCSVVFRIDGAILLTSGGTGGTVLATYTGAVPAPNIWNGFEIEVVVHNTAGSITVRKNGSPTNDFSLGSLNTRGGTANNYANQALIGAASGSSYDVDDFLWRSDASSVAWVGDIRCYTRMPASDAAVQWSQGSPPAGLIQSQPGSTTTAGISNTIIKLQPYTLNYTGTITTVILATGNAAAGNIKCAIWADSGGVPGAVLASTSSQATMAAGNNVFTLSTPLAVTVGQRIWIGGIIDTSAGQWSTSSGTLTGGSAPGSFATFPQASPVTTTGVQALTSSITYGTPPGNFSLVSETQQDAAISYVYSSTVGQTDLYGIAPISVTPASVVGVTTRALAQKTDAGTRNIGVQLKSGGTTSNGTSTALNTTFGWVWRNDLVDPATGAAWTPVAVNNLQIGETVTA